MPHAQIGDRATAAFAADASGTVPRRYGTVQLSEGSTV